jgi:hypothetical protein
VLLFVAFWPDLQDAVPTSATERMNSLTCCNSC